MQSIKLKQINMEHFMTLLLQSIRIPCSKKINSHISAVEEFYMLMYNSALICTSLLLNKELMFPTAYWRHRLPLIVCRHFFDCTEDYSFSDYFNHPLLIILNTSYQIQMVPGQFKLKGEKRNIYNICNSDLNN